MPGRGRGFPERPSCSTQRLRVALTPRGRRLMRLGASGGAREVVEEDGGGHGDVQGIGAELHGDGYPAVAEGEVLGGEPLGFVAEEDAQARRAADGVEVFGGVVEDGGDEFDAVVLAEAAEVAGEVVAADDGEVEGGAHRD